MREELAEVKELVDSRGLMSEGSEGSEEEDGEGEEEDGEGEEEDGEGEEEDGEGEEEDGEERDEMETEGMAGGGNRGKSEGGGNGGKSEGRGAENGGDVEMVE